jgi:Leucine-rich repeat (LRR) protein
VKVPVFTTVSKFPVNSSFFSFCSDEKAPLSISDIKLSFIDNRIQSINELGFSIAGNLSSLNLVTLYLSKNRLKSIPPAIKTVETILHLELSGFGDHYFLRKWIQLS